MVILCFKQPKTRTRKTRVKLLFIHIQVARKNTRSRSTMPESKAEHNRTEQYNTIKIQMLQLIFFSLSARRNGSSAFDVYIISYVMFTSHSPSFVGRFDFSSCFQFARSYILFIRINMRIPKPYFLRSYASHPAFSRDRADCFSLWSVINMSVGLYICELDFSIEMENFDQYVSKESNANIEKI